MNKLDTAIKDARLLLREQHSGILSTISLSVKGYPFGSITPFMLTGTGSLVIYASDIAQHARNMKADPKVSICIHDAQQDDSQASARVTVLGKAEADQVTEADQQRYFRLFPKAESYKNTHDFRFYLITPTRVRFIGGFGEIFWFSEEQWLSSFVDMEQSEMPAIEHMHDDHLDALEAISEFMTGSPVSVPPKMASIFHDGFHMNIEGQTRFVAFEQALQEPAELRKAMVQITKTARKSELKAVVGV